MLFLILLQVVIDNYLDGGYHVPSCHRDLSSNLDNSSYKIELFDGFSIQSSDGKGSDDRIGDKVLFGHIYPNIFINRYGKSFSL